jgi:hypothetical protein
VDATEVAAQLIDWAQKTCPGLVGAYDRDPAAKTQPLPDVAAYCTAERWTDRDPDTGEHIEQADFHVLDMRLLLMVVPDDEADDLLKGFVADLVASLRADQTLASRVGAVGAHPEATYDPPFIKFDDGTEGRAVEVSLTVAEIAT